MKKLLSIIALAFSLASNGQKIYLLADNVKGTSAVYKDAFDITSIGTSITCNCTMAQGPALGLSSGAKIVFNLKNEGAAISFKRLLMSAKANGNAYFIFKAGSPTGVPISNPTDYFVKLTKYTVLEIAEATDNGGNHTLQISLGYTGLNWTGRTSASGSSSTVNYGWDFVTKQELPGTALPPNWTF